MKKEAERKTFHRDESSLGPTILFKILIIISLVLGIKKKLNELGKFDNLLLLLYGKSCELLKESSPRKKGDLESFK